MSDLDIKAISTIGIGIQDNEGDVISATADIVAEYSKTILGITVVADTNSIDFDGNKLSEAYMKMVKDVTQRLLINKPKQ